MKRYNKGKDNILIEMAKKKPIITLSENEIINMTKREILDLIHNNNKVISVMHPTAQERKDIKKLSKEEFSRRVVKCGSSGHIGVSRHWVGKAVKVTMEEIEDI